MLTTTSALQRWLARLLVIAVAGLGLVALDNGSPALATPASPVRIFTETSQTFDPTYALSSGWWGHEDASHADPTTFSLDADDSTGEPSQAGLAAALAKIGPDATLSDLHIAFVATSSDGSAEDPVITAGETVGKAFTWFIGAPVGGSENGTDNANDGITAVSTDASYNAWYNAGQLPYGFDDNLVVHDTTQPGDPASGAHAVGTSILNTWPAGTAISMVYYVSTATNASNEQIVTIGPNGKAEAAWLPLTTVGLPSDHSQDPTTGFPASYDTLRTSAGYQVAGALTKPTVTLKDTWTNGTGTLTASVTDGSGNALTGATGTVQFSARPKNATSGDFSDVGSAVTVTNGTASTTVTGLSPGDVQEYEATYTPDTAASSSYTAATSSQHTVIAQAGPTTTALTVTGSKKAGGTATLAIKVTSGGTQKDVTGTATLLDGTKTITNVAVTNGAAVQPLALSVGTHKLSVSFSSTAGYPSSTSNTVSWTIAKASPTITVSTKPKTVKAGSKPSLTVKVKASGAKPTGSLVITVKPPHGASKKIRAKLGSGGTATVKLPAAVKGSTKVTVKYAGSSTVASATKTYTFKAK